MKRDDHYRQMADEAQRMANEASCARDRESWLRLACGWLSMITGEPRTDADRFEEAANIKGTGQDISDRSQ
jgi:hypothetical protein